jgi:hypothetical protein
MGRIKKRLKAMLKNPSFVKIFILTLLGRLFFIETNELVLISEILTSIIIIITNDFTTLTNSSE